MNLYLILIKGRIGRELYNNTYIHMYITLCICTNGDTVRSNTDTEPEARVVLIQWRGERVHEDPLSRFRVFAIPKCTTAIIAYACMKRNTA